MGCIIATSDELDYVVVARDVVGKPLQRTHCLNRAREELVYFSSPLMVKPICRLGEVGWVVSFLSSSKTTVKVFVVRCQFSNYDRKLAVKFLI